LPRVVVFAERGEKMAAKATLDLIDWAVFARL
jgi:hypothetical protein